MAASVPVVAAASIDQRFAHLIQQFGLTKNSFAISLGKTASVIQHLIDGRNKPGFDLMCKVFEVYPNVSRDWLLLGRGPMLVGSNGMSGPALAAAQPAPSEPDFEPIDLADVAPRAARRPAANRLHPEEIAATLALASVAANSAPAAMAMVTPEEARGFEPAVSENRSPLQSPAASFRPAALPIAPGLPVAPAPARQVARPFRPAPAGRPAADSVAAAPSAAASLPVAAVAEAPAPQPPQPESAVLASMAPVPQPGAAAAVGGPEAYVAAAIHAQHLQHQLALAELRNHHLLEQQQMLREMLAMARQSMV